MNKTIHNRLSPLHGWTCRGNLGPYAGVVLFVIASSTPIRVHAQHTVYFSTSDIGQTKAIPQWGVDTAWPSVDNMRLSMAHMGVDQIDVVRLNFYKDEPLEQDGTLGPNARARIDHQLGIAAMAPAVLEPPSSMATIAPTFTPMCSSSSRIDSA